MDAHFLRHVIEQAGTEKEPVLVARHDQAAPVDDQLSTFGNALRDQRAHPVVVRPRDQRPHLDAGLRSRADLQPRNPLRQQHHQPVGHRIANRHHHRDRHAAFAAGTVGCADQRVHGVVEVGVGHHEGVVLRATQRLHTLAVSRCAGVDVFRHRRRANEAERLHTRIDEQRIDRLAVTVHDVEHAVGQPCLAQEPRQRQRRTRIAL